MILTDDNFATIIRAVELGRALYDNLVRYIRFQMACLFGFIATFLGSSLLFIAGGLPFLPLQTLFINFTVQVALAIGLGYGKPRPDLMHDAPRAPDVPILSRRLIIWLIAAGLVMAVVTLGIISWATPLYGEETARTMGLVAFAVQHLVRARDLRRGSPCFSPETPWRNSDIAWRRRRPVHHPCDRARDHQHDPRHGQSDGGPVAHRLRRIARDHRHRRGQELLKIRTTTVPGLALTEAASAAA